MEQVAPVVTWLMERTSNPTSLDSAETTEEEFNWIVEVFNISWTLLSDQHRQQLTSAMKKHWTKLTNEEKIAFTNAIKWKIKLSNCLTGQGARPFRKAKDTDLMNACKFIENGILVKLATKYLGMSVDQISGLNVFNVLKKWRDDKPYQGSKQVQYDYFLVFVCPNNEKLK